MKLPLTLQLNRPFPCAHDWFAGTIALNAFDIQAAGADHEIGVDQAFVPALCSELFIRHLFTADDRFAIGISQCNVAGCIFIEKAVIEQNAALANGRAVGDECYLAEPTRVFIHFNHLAKGFLTLLGRDINHLAVFKCQAEILDHHAAII